MLWVLMCLSCHFLFLEAGNNLDKLSTCKIHLSNHPYRRRQCPAPPRELTDCWSNSVPANLPALTVWTISCLKWTGNEKKPHHIFKIKLVILPESTFLSSTWKIKLHEFPERKIIAIVRLHEQGIYSSVAGGQHFLRQVAEVYGCLNYGMSWYHCDHMNLKRWKHW